jgi:hypothetical protein
MNSLALLGHAEIIKAVTGPMDATTISSAIPNLQYLLAAENTETSLNSVTEPTYDNLEIFAKQGLISSQDLSMARIAKIPPADILFAMKQSNKNVEDWMNLPNEFKPFALASGVNAFKPKPYEVSVNMVNNAIQNTSVEDIDTLDEISANTLLPKPQREYAKTVKLALQTAYSNKRVAEVASNNVYNMPDTFAVPEDYETNANAYNTALATQIAQLNSIKEDTASNTNINKINQKVILDRIAQLDAAKIPTQQIAEKKAAIAATAKAAKEKEEGIQAEIYQQMSRVFAPSNEQGKDRKKEKPATEKQKAETKAAIEKYVRENWDTIVKNRKAGKSGGGGAGDKGSAGWGGEGRAAAGSADRSPTGGM